MLKRLFVLIFLSGLLVGCGDDDFGTSPATVPFLFQTWQLKTETTSCPDDDPVVVQVEQVILLTIKQSSFTLTTDGVVTHEGDLRFDSEEMYFTPSPFPNNFLGAATWIFNGSNLVLNSSEAKGPGSLETCSVRRAFFDL